ncbi:hypothetical protein HMPREF1574_00788 [Gardnerella pickettii JCP7659]|nr:hypothetical protein HMPREF1574_00788 [Gardnerella pickettii JCP7659]
MTIKIHQKCLYVSKILVKSPSKLAFNHIAQKSLQKRSAR